MMSKTLLDRWNLMHNELFKFKDHDEEYCLSPVKQFLSCSFLVEHGFS